MNAMLRAQQEVFGIMPDSKIGMEMAEAFEEAERERRIDALMTAMRDVEHNPTMIKCKRCDGRGYYHGFGEHGHDPDWCRDCGGGQYEHDARADAERILNVLEAFK